MGVGKFSTWGSSGGTSHKIGEDIQEHMYHHAKFQTIGATVAEVSATKKINRELSYSIPPY